MTSKVDVHTKILYPPDEKKPTMTKAEAEVIWRKNELLALCSKTDLAFNERLKKRFDSLIAAAHAEGVAEGAEELRMRLLETAIRNRASDTYVVLASVLAPTKEKP